MFVATMGHRLGLAVVLAIAGCATTSPAPTNDPPSLMPDTDPMMLPVELYKMDFRGAERLRVIEVDQTTDGHPTRTATIDEPAMIARVVDILAALPKRGPIIKRMGPTVVTRVVAYRRATPFAYVQYYSSRLKTERGFFGHRDERVNRQESELYELVRSALEAP